MFFTPISGQFLIAHQITRWVCPRPTHPPPLVFVVRTQNNGAMRPTLIELQRQLDNLIRIGTVSAVRSGQCRVKTGELETNWRPYLVPRAGNTRTRQRPTLGEQVLLLSVSGDLRNAYVLPALYQAQMAEPLPEDDDPDLDRLEYPDGAVLEYRPSTGELLASGIKTARISASVCVFLDTPLTECSQDLKVGGAIECAESIKAGGTIETPQGLKAQSASINGVEFGDHRHGGVENGSGTTEGPQ